MTIDLRASPSEQISSDQVRATTEAARETLTEAKHSNPQADIWKNVSSGNAANLGVQANPSAPNDGGPERQDDPPPEDEDPYRFGYLIVEEDPPSAQ